MMKIFGSKFKSARRAAGLFCFFSLFLSQPSPAAKKRGAASVFQRPSLDDSLNASLNDREGRTERLLTELCSADSSDDKKNCLKTRRLAGNRPANEPGGGERLWVEKLLSASPPSGFDKSFFEA